MAWPAVYGLGPSDFEGRRDRRTARPTIILVHEAFHSPTHFEKLSRELRATGHRVLTPRLPSSTGSFLPNSMEADVQAVHEACRLDVDAGQDIVMVLHGYAGLPGCTAAERLNQHALRRPRAGFVVKIIFIAAVIANADECFLDIVLPHWFLRENGHLRARNPDLVFFQDCSFEDTRAAVSAISPQLLDSFRSKITNPGWSRIPCVYVVCEIDQAVTVIEQQAFIRKLQTVNQRVAVVTLRCGHSPFLSRPREIAALIVRSTSGDR